jgi:hypothetical protein
MVPELDNSKNNLSDAKGFKIKLPFLLNIIVQSVRHKQLLDPF